MLHLTSTNVGQVLLLDFCIQRCTFGIVGKNFIYINIYIVKVGSPPFIDNHAMCVSWFWCCCCVLWRFDTLCCTSATGQERRRVNQQKYCQRPCECLIVYKSREKCSRHRGENDGRKGEKKTSQICIPYWCVGIRLIYTFYMRSAASSWMLNLWTNMHKYK